MPAQTVPVIDQALPQEWTEQDRSLFHQMPHYFVTKQIERRKEFAVFPKLTGKVKWTPNEGPIMRSVRKEPSPHLRSFAFPKPIDEAPLRDVLQVREMHTDAIIRWQDFETLNFNFLPDFRDFMKDHIKSHTTDINEKILRFNDVFIRSEMFHSSPYVVLPGAAGDVLTVAPTAAGNTTNTAASSKNLDWLATVLPLITVEGLSAKALANAVNAFSEDLDVPYFSGEGISEVLQGKYRLVLSNEARRSWTFDPYVLANKAQIMDLVTKKFTTTPFDDTIGIKERFPIRFAMDALGAVTVPAPQTQELNPAAINYGETIINPAYAAAQYEVAFLAGAGGYDSIQIGMPPSTFTGGYEPSNFKKMKWNGEVTITKDILIPVADANGAIVRYDTNKYGRHLQLIANATFGVSAFQPRNVLPIIFKRKRVIT